ncbi:hypothetical protein [Spongiibacter tropicus]|uniref:hypothetical protein n=1 Tax=Spongiibacter tropicus TaxID=454602 RepID=UPI0024E1A069|nr:hypothetical protein [Spongiibacter tropicus]
MINTDVAAKSSGRVGSGLSVKSIDLSVFLMSLGLMVYAGFSNPTPDNVGPFEVFFVSLIFLAIGIFPVVKLMTFVPFVSNMGLGGHSRYLAFYLSVFLFALVGVLKGYPVSDIARDFVAFTFLFFPVLLCQSKLIYMSEKQLDYLCISLGVVGAVMAARHLVVAGFSFSGLGSEFYSEHELYLSTDPSVLFSSIFLPFRAIEKIAKSRVKGDLIISLLMFLAGMIATLALAAKGHRGPMFLIASSWLIFLFLRGFFSLKVFVCMTLASIVVGLMYSDAIYAVYEMLMKKQEAHGINARDLELFAAWNAVSDGYLNLFFGLGFGSHFYNPAAGGVYVNFAHMYVAWAILKGGLLGALFLVVYALSFVKPAYLVFKRDASLSLAIASPLIIGAVVNGSYRMLTFGVILFICIVAAHRQSAAQLKNS